MLVSKPSVSPAWAKRTLYTYLKSHCSFVVLQKDESLYVMELKQRGRPGMGEWGGFLQAVVHVDKDQAPLPEFQADKKAKSSKWALILNKQDVEETCTKADQRHRTERNKEVSRDIPSRDQSNPPVKACHGLTYKFSSYIHHIPPRSSPQTISCPELLTVSLAGAPQSYSALEDFTIR